MKKFLLGSAILAALVAGPAMAADMPVKARPLPPPPVYNWTGLYVGGNIGYGWGHQNINYTPNDPASSLFINAGQNLVFGDSFALSGVVGGLQVGYNYQFNRSWLIGLETDFDWTGIKGSGQTSYFGGFALSSAAQRIKWFGTVRARLGYLPADNLLAYFTGGFAYGKVEDTTSYVATNGGVLVTINDGFGVGCGIPALASNTCYAGSSSEVLTGWTLGGGLEYALWQSWTVKAEYLYVSLKGKTVTELGTPLPPPLEGFAQSSLNANFGRTNFNVVRVGLNYRFDWGKYPVAARY